MNEVDITIIGAGAAGMFLASNLKQSLNIAVIEHNKDPGKKIRISGGGRCNFTNMHFTFNDFVSKNEHFCKSALSGYSSYDFMDLVEKHKIAYFEKRLGQLFCKNSSKEIIEMLKTESSHASYYFEHSVQNIEYTDEKYLITTSQGDFCSKSLIIATGGLSFPKIGASNFGYQLAKQFGHSIEPTTPALVYLQVPNVAHLSGISLVAKVKIRNFNHSEEILFTHKGISGPAILKASLFYEQGDQLEIDLMPEVDFQSILMSEKNITNTLCSYLPQKLVEHCLAISEINGDLFFKNLIHRELTLLESSLKKLTLTPSSDGGFGRAEVTKGGVSTKKVSSKTMESKNQRNLYFIGEVLDVTGQLGGFNFQWAWASAYAAAKDLNSKFS